ncbi:WD40 repeat-like protein [Hyaloscypha variabilis F]|uniref:WD40 repeat-like protein n=1 Tax=Hyaloscypha variabilis (strain UAMH 11265 / GT02V1 / F) TaxID=1149755 RepID=A0A2J6RHB4_HYAVF|nr:WD40 repeat-like protein [Hyaloscypha variabilis F]
MRAWDKIKSSVKGEKIHSAQGSKKKPEKEGNNGPANSESPDMPIATSSQGSKEASSTKKPSLPGSKPQAPHEESVSAAKAHVEEPVAPTTQSGGSSDLISSSVARVQISQSKDDLTTEPAPTGSKSFRPEHLWDLAYDSLKTDEPKLVEAYEKTLSHEMNEPLSNDSAVGNHAASGTQKNVIEQNNPEKRRLQMEKAVQAGLKRTEKEAKAKEGLDTVVNIVLSTKTIVDSALQAAPYAALAWSGCCFALQILLNPIQQTSANRDGITYVLRRMKWYWELSKLLLKETVSEEFTGPRTELQSQIVDLYKSILLYQMQSVCSYYSRVLSFLRDIVKLDDWDGKLTAIENSEKNFRHDSDAYRAQYQLEILRGISEAIERQSSLQEKLRMNEDNKRCLQDLRLTDPSVDMRSIEASKDNLLKDSYVWVLQRQEYIHWRDGDGGQLLWIKGGPGKGKTMLAIGLIRELSKQKWDNDALSFFFCEAGRESSSTATAVLRGLLYQLVSQQISLIKYVRKEWDVAGAKLFDPNDRNTYTALLDIFTGMLQDSDLKRIHLVVDALDECQVGLPQLLDFIRKVCLSNHRVKWLVTGRPRVDIEEQIRLHDDHLELDLERNAQENVSSAVKAYITHKVLELSKQKRFSTTLEIEVRDGLEKRADGTFLWVALVCKTLAAPKTTVRKTMETLNSLPSGLKNVYQRMLEDMSDPELIDQDDLIICNQILAAVTLAYEPLNLDELVSIAGFPELLPMARESVEELVKHCGSFLIIRGNLVYFIHQSAREFCQSRKLPTGLESPKSGPNPEIFPQGQAQVHLDIISRSLQVMEDTLCKDVYDFKDLGCSINEFERPCDDPLIRSRYACNHWVDHLVPLNKQQRELSGLHDNGRVHQFLQLHLLHWFEALTWMEILPRGIVMLETLCSLLKDGNNSSLLDMLQDAKRSVLYCKAGIEAAPLQIYASALIFSPDTSKAKQQFLHDIPPFIKGCSGVEKFWSPLLQTIEVTSDILRGSMPSLQESAVFSPDGSLLASFSKHLSGIGIWDTETGTLRRNLNGPKYGNNCVAFSPNNRWIAAAGPDSVAQMWNLDYESDQKTLEGHAGILDVAFSHTGDFLASASRHRDIRVWDIKKFPSHLVLRGHKGWVTQVVFAPNGNQLASASSRDFTVRVWDDKTGIQLHVFRYQSALCTILGIRWESQLQHVMRDRGPSSAIQLWDSIDQKLLLSIDSIDCLPPYEISPDGSLLVAVSQEKPYNIKFMDTATPRENVLNMRTGLWDCGLSFSRDGSRLAIANDGLVTLVDVEMAMKSSDDDLSGGHRSDIDLLLFSDDGKQLASLSNADSNYSTICLWKIKTEFLQWNFQKFHIPGRASEMAFTPDGRCLLANSFEIKASDAVIAAAVYTLRIWDTETGTLWHQSNCGDIEIHSNSFSQDGSWFALPCENIIKVWNINSRMLFTIDPALDLSLEQVHFSPNSHQIVATSGARIFLWNMKTLDLQDVGKEEDNIASSSFSDNGRWLEVEGNKDLSTSGHNRVFRLSFSCDGSWLAVTFYNSTAILLDIKSGDTRRPLGLEDVNGIRFSPDGRMFVSVSGRIIRLWDLKSRTLLREFPNHPERVRMMKFSGDGTQIISAALGGTIHCWDVASGKMQEEFEDYEYKWSRSSDDFRSRDRPNRPTNRGTFMLQQPGLWSPYSISEDGSWITRNGRKLLWLPREYRPDMLDIQDNVLAMGYKSGRVLIIRFDQEYSVEQSLAMMREGQGVV